MADERKDGEPDYISGWPDYEADLRDRFAGQALCGLVEIYNGMAADPTGVADAAYEYADAMLQARQKGGEQ